MSDSNAHARIVYPCSQLATYDIVCLWLVPTTMELPIMDPPTRGQPLCKGHWLRHRLGLL